jgi:hypothetical protein
MKEIKILDFEDHPKLHKDRPKWYRYTILTLIITINCTIQPTHANDNHIGDYNIYKKLSLVHQRNVFESA